ncbi:hypothetical protein [Streptomyces sp. NPDC102360]|uniref:glycosyltransferase family 39 protein n=1 Tax=Streptomyces sp. NPDC102360 TaxID=3366160 RepID=UPI0038243E88
MFAQDEDVHAGERDGIGAASPGCGFVGQVMFGVAVRAASRLADSGHRIVGLLRGVELATIALLGHLAKNAILRIGCTKVPGWSTICFLWCELDREVLVIPSHLLSSRPMVGRPVVIKHSRVRNSLCWALPVAMTLLFGLFRITRDGSIWRDEAVTFNMAQRAPSSLWDTILNSDAVHGLYYFLMHLVFGVFGANVYALRVPSVIATVAAVVGVVALGRRLATPLFGCVAGLIYGLLPLVQQYAQEGRSYALVSALVIWMTYVFTSAELCSGRLSQVTYCLLGVFAVNLHEFAILAVAAHGVSILLSESGCTRRDTLRIWTLISLPILAAVVPVAFISFQQSEQVGWIGWPEPASLIIFVIGTWAIHKLRTISDPGPRATRLYSLSASLMAVPAGLLLMAGIYQPMYVDRYVLYGMAGFSLAGAALLTRAWEFCAGPQRTRLILAIMLCLLALIPQSLSLRRPESRVDNASAVTKVVEKVSRSGDGILYIPGRRRVWTAVTPNAYGHLKDLALAQSPSGSHTLYGAEVAAGQVQERVISSRRIVTLEDPETPDIRSEEQEDAAKRRVLKNFYTRCSSKEVRGALINVYVRGGCS